MLNSSEENYCSFAVYFLLRISTEKGFHCRLFNFNFTALLDD